VRVWLAAGLALLAAIGPAYAGAWTLDRHKMQTIAGMTTSSAASRFGDGGAIVFNKLLYQTSMEYGLTNAVTLFAIPEYVLARSDMTGNGIHSVRSFSFEVGLRILLLSRIGMLSVQVSGKSAGAFDMSVSASGEAGRQFEARLLYGRNFRLFGRNGFVDIEVAERWIARPRPDETVLDATAGLWVTRNNLILAQSFNFRTDGGARPPYQAYRLDKLQLSLVRRLGPHWSMQSGYFFSLAGRNMVKETGVISTIWFRT
jgi:protein XagA